MLKPCPFCGGAFRVVESAGPNNLTVYHESEDESCPMEAHETWCGPEYLDRYDLRPIEDALTARAEKAERERDDRANLVSALTKGYNEMMVERDEVRAKIAAADRLLRSLDPEHSPCVVDDAIAALSDAPAMAVVEGWTYHDNKDPDDFWTREEWMNVTPTKERDSQIPVTVVVLHAKAKE